MKDEIKEILDQLEIVARKHTIEVCEDGSKIETMPASVVNELRLNNYSSKKLLDYITNLQEDYDRAMILVDKGVENSYIKIREQQKEIEKLTAESTEWESKCYDLQERNEKAIEYVEKNKHIIRFDKLKNILQGESD